MARSTARMKHFGMAKPVKKSPTQKRKNSKKSTTPSPVKKTQKLLSPVKKTQAKPKKSSPSRPTTKAPPVNKQADKPKSIPKPRSTQSIQKRENANANKPTANRRSAPKNTAATGNRKIRSKTEESTNFSEKSVSKTANAQKSCKQSSASKLSGNKSPSVFDRTSISMYRALDFVSKTESTGSTSESLVVALDDVVIESAGETHLDPSPDLFGTDTMDGNVVNDSTNVPQNEIPRMVEMASIGTQTDAVEVTQMTDAGTQTIPMLCNTCKRDVREIVVPETNSSDGDDSDGGDGDNEFNSFNEFAVSDDDNSFASYHSSSSYDHCLDDFDCLEHLDNVDPCQSPNKPTVNGRDKPITDDIATVIDNSPPRHQIYKNHQFHSPESLELQTNH